LIVADFTLLHLSLSKLTFLLFTELSIKRMGNTPSVHVLKEDNYDEYPVCKNQIALQRKISIPLQIQVAHFTPSSFPMIPIVNPQSSELCADSWAKIVGQVIKTEDGTSITGMTVFYNEFYERLSMFDSSGKFDAVLSRHSGGQNQIAAKGAIILRIVKFVVRIDVDSKQNDMMLYMLGKSHSQKSIRPWQYAIFVQTLLNAISSRLGVDATSNVMEAWVNLFAYVMQGMLPPAIKGQVVETELNVNTSNVLE
jgi:hemoglobin-like flavoprotein